MLVASPFAQKTTGGVRKDKSFVMFCANAKEYSPKTCVHGTVQRTQCTSVTYSYIAVIYNSSNICQNSSDLWRMAAPYGR